MSKTNSHKAGKDTNSHRSGRVEYSIKGDRDGIAYPKRAVEIERSGSLSGLQRAATRLKASRRSQKILQVPQKDMDKAVGMMRTVGVSGTVKNMSGTKKRYVSRRK